MPSRVVEPPVAVELQHRPGCPAAAGQPLGDPEDLTDARKGSIRVEAYVVTGTGRYNRVTGDFEAVPRTGVVRCIECANETLVPAEDIKPIQKMLAALAVQEVQTNA